MMAYNEAIHSSLISKSVGLSYYNLHAGIFACHVVFYLHPASAGIL